MKTPERVQNIVLWGLLIFFGIVILASFFIKAREGMEDAKPSSTTATSNDLGTTGATPATAPTKTDTTGAAVTNEEKIVSLTKQISDLQKQLSDIKSGSGTGLGASGSVGSASASGSAGSGTASGTGTASGSSSKPV